ncbi:hypothetical protein Syun_025868 [Stephania yunnanensis]|uniref:Uncharacterized protein n=1 Tax=Stephania yunnanensis TaxID=152371 RepID=A0AAP0EXY9_9MAGN
MSLMERRSNGVAERSARSIRTCVIRSSVRSPNRIDCLVDPLQKFNFLRSSNLFDG